MHHGAPALLLDSDLMSTFFPQNDFVCAGDTCSRVPAYTNKTQSTILWNNLIPSAITNENNCVLMHVWDKGKVYVFFLSQT